MDHITYFKLSAL
uniref:Uncharacterized protein n=1 Tax=Anguilla anguilla TaxID=7936 RepID=A0A0E9T6M6_ANGAN